MRTIYTLLAVLCLITTTSAFAPVAFSPRTGVASATSATTLNMVFGNKKTQNQKVEDEKVSKFWQGDWVCKDCGYIYNRVCRD